MPLQVPSYAGDPTSTAPVVNAYVAIVHFALSSFDQSVSFTTGYFRSKAEYDAGVKPVGTTPYTITANPETVHGVTRPSYAEMVAGCATLPTDPAGTLAFALVERSIETFLLSLPEFATATQVA